MTGEFFDPIQQHALIAHLRRELNVLKIQLDLLEQLGQRSGITVDASESRRLMGQLEAKISAIELRYSTIN